MIVDGPSGHRISLLLDAAGFRHAFFTRRGGVSTGPYATLNFSVAVGDRPENVARNLERAAHVLGVPVDRIYFLSQVHGADCLVVQGDEPRDDVIRCQGDALVSRTAGVACCVRVADCVPILVGDRGTGGALAIHAGWRGMVRGVIGAGVAKLREVAGASSDLVAAIGPHISVEAFEVSEDVAAALLDASPDPNVVDNDRGDKPHVDLRRIARAQLRRAGIDDAAIDDVLGCTVGDREFFSYRRDGPLSGRHLAAIVARR